VVHRRRVTERVGGWGNYRDLTILPEFDLWRRAYDGGHKFVFVPRLTAIKFPASKRPDVYRQTPHHEQAEWFERIRSEPGLEAVELVGMLATAVKVRPLNELRYTELARGFLSETIKRARRRLRGILSPAPQPRPGEQLEAYRLLKGLPPKL
jgi:hypothetical protein